VNAPAVAPLARHERLWGRTDSRRAAKQLRQPLRRFTLKNVKRSAFLLAILAAAVVAVVAGAFGRNANAHQGIHMDMSMKMATGAKAEELRVGLNRLLGEHALLATEATDAGYSGSKSFAAIAKQLDDNSVAISKAIASVYGAAAGNQFLNGKNLWRAHIKYFVEYMVAKAKNDNAGQKKAVANLMAYIQTQAAFFAKATGLPKQALVNDLTAHVLQLKGQLDAYAAGNYAHAAQLQHGAYVHMGMTADILAAAIAKQKNLR
jgi:hypothetical protein